MLGDGTIPGFGQGSTPPPSRASAPRSCLSCPAMLSDMKATALVKDLNLRLATRTSSPDDESHAPSPVSRSRHELPPV